MNCQKYSELESELRNTLQKLQELAESQLAAFRACNQPEFIRLDKELEQTMGAKKRVIGAFRQHAEEHNCQGKSAGNPQTPSPLKNQERASTG